MWRVIDEYKQQELKSKKSRLSYQTVADLHKVSKSTLQRLVTGGVSMSAFNAGKQRLTLVEEHVVVDFLTLLGSNRSLYFKLSTDRGPDC
jgi:hypothetical protein